MRCGEMRFGLALLERPPDDMIFVEFILAARARLSMLIGFGVAVLIELRRGLKLLKKPSTDMMSIVLFFAVNEKNSGGGKNRCADDQRKIALAGVDVRSVLRGG